MRRLILLALMLLAVARAADAQQSISVDRIYLGPTPCQLRTGPGEPTGGSSCEFFLSTTTGDVWQNVGGTWRIITTRPTVQTLNATTSVTTPVVSATTSVTSPLVTVPLLKAPGAMTLQPTGSIVLDPQSRTVLPGVNFGVSIGAPEQKFLTLFLGELYAETLVAQDVMSTIGGRILVAPTTQLVIDFPASGPGSATLHVKHNNLQNGDIVFMQSAPGGVPQIEFMRIASAATGGAGDYSYSIARNLDGSGQNNWYAGDAVLNTGTVGKGFIDLYALSGVLTGFGPTVVGNVRTGTAYNAFGPRWALGNLRNVGYGHAGDAYGFAAGNPQGAYLYLDDANGLVMTGPQGTRVQITPVGTATFTGDGGGVTNINGGYIQTGTVTANAIAADAITAEKIGAGTITSDKIAVGLGGGALNADPETRDVTAWTSGGNGYPTVIDAGVDGKVGRYALRGAANTYIYEKKFIPADPNKTYRFHVWARNYGANANGTLYAGVDAQDGNGNVLNGEGTTTGGTLWFYCASNASPSYLWTEYTCPFGAGTAKTIPSNMKVMRPLLLMNYGGSVGLMDVQDVRIEEAVPSTLIQDGAITTGKVVANAITADKIAAAAITADKIASGSGTNQIRNSECRYSTEEWNPTNWGGQGTMQSGISLGSPWQLNDEPGTCWIAAQAQPVNGAVGWFGRALPAEAGKKYEASVFVQGLYTTGAPTANIYAYLWFTDSAGNATDVRPNVGCSGQGTDGRWLANYCRTWVVATAPPGTVNVRFLVLQYFQQYQANSYLIFTRAFLAEAKPNQTEPSEWTPAGLTEITGGMIKTGTIQASSIAVGTITGTQIANGAINSANIADGAVTGTDIAATTIVGGNIATGTIGALQIAARTITADRITAYTLTSTEIAARAITGDRIVAGTLTATEIAARSISADRIVAGSLTATEIAARSIYGDRIVAGSLTGTEIAAGSIRTANLEAGAVTADKISVGSLSAITANLGTVNAGTINGVDINGSTIVGGGGNVTISPGDGLRISGDTGRGKLHIGSGNTGVYGDNASISLDAGTVYAVGDLQVNGQLRGNGNVNFSGQYFDIANSINASNQNNNFQRNVSVGGLLNANDLHITGGIPFGDRDNAQWDNGCKCFYYDTSSRRYKQNIRPWVPADPLAILKVPLVMFDYIAQPQYNVPVQPNVIGMIAEDAYTIVPEVVGLDDQLRPNTIRQRPLTMYTIAALKELQTRIAKQAEQIEELEQKIAALMAARKDDK